MSVASSPIFGKTLLTRILRIILPKNSFQESLILLRLLSFWILKIVKKYVTMAIFSVTIPQYLIKVIFANAWAVAIVIG